MKKNKRNEKDPPEVAKPKSKTQKVRKKFGVERGRRNGPGHTPKWWHATWYETEKERDKAYEGLSKKGKSFFNPRFMYEDVYRKVERD